MWSKYDELLLQNPFLIEIQSNHGDILQKSAKENWTICVPRIGTIEPDDITVETIFDHILIPGEGDNTYQTLSKKTLVVQNKHIIRQSSHDSIAILFEETFYVQKKLKYKVWCVDHPLFWKSKSSHMKSIRNIEDLRDCLDFLWTESSGHSILDGIKNTVLSSAAKCEEIAGEDLQTQKEFIGVLYSQCLQVGMKNEIIQDKVKDYLFFDDFKLAVETYMQYCLGKSLIYSIGSACHRADSHLTKIIKNSNHLHYNDLGISSKFLNMLTASKSELARMNNYLTALEKINCLKKTFHIFHDNSSGLDHIITSDHILTVLVFLILKLNINNWVANLIYLKEFRLCSMESSDQVSFIISSLEAAIEFIKSSEFLLLKKGLEKTTDFNYSKVLLISDGIKSGHVDEFKNSVQCDIPKHEPCHPLCICRKCTDKEKNESTSNTDLACSQNLLISATISGFPEVVDFLLNQGVDPNDPDSFGKTSLHHAVSRGHQSILFLLLNCSGNFNSTDNDGNTPLHLACLNGQENCVKALMYSSKIVNLDSCNSLGETPLHLATVCGYYEIVKILLDNGASPHVKNKRNQTPFDVVPNYHIKKLFQKCISDLRISPEALRRINKNDNISQTKPIERQIENFRKIDLLLKAIESNDLPLTTFYLGFHSETENVKTNPCHPLCTCNTCKNTTDVNTQESNIENINMSDMNGFTPLHMAAKFGRTEILKVLLEYGALVDVKTNKTRQIPLHLACIYRHPRIVKDLLKCGCKVDEPDSQGNTPLFYACENNDIDIVAVLLRNGANCNIKNSAGRSAYQLCEENTQYSLMKMLDSYVVDCVVNNINDFI